MLYISEEIFDFQIHKSEDLSCKGRVNFILCRLTKQTRTTRLKFEEDRFLLPLRQSHQTIRVNQNSTG